MPIAPCKEAQGARDAKRGALEAFPGRVLAEFDEKFADERGEALFAGGWGRCLFGWHGPVSLLQSAAGRKGPAMRAVCHTPGLPATLRDKMELTEDRKSGGHHARSRPARADPEDARRQQKTLDL